MRDLRRLNVRRVAQFLEATFELLRAELTVRRRGGTRWHAALGALADPDTTRPPAADDGVASRVARALAAANRRSPWHHRCLVEAVAATRMLRRRGTLSRTFVGGHREGPGHAVGLHAWVVSGEVVVAGGRTHDEFVPVVAYDRVGGRSSRRRRGSDAGVPRLTGRSPN